jgi:hypothetical protein
MLSEQFQNTINMSKKEETSIPLTHKYMTAHFLGWVINSGGVKLVSWDRT